MIKKLIVIISAAMAAVAAKSDTEMVDGIEWTYTVSGGAATIRRAPTLLANTVAIPSTLGGFAVVSIGDYAFQGCSSLMSIAIPSSVTNIGHSAFDGCCPKEVSLPGWNCGIDLSSVTNLVIADGTTTIRDYGFCYCTSLMKVIIPNSVESIGTCAFADCSSLESLTIPKGVESIGDSAFYGCDSLVNVILPNSVTNIGSYAFNRCNALSDVYISDLTAWCQICFEDAESNPMYYAHNFFLNGTAISNLIIPDTVEGISSWAFCNFDSLKSITFPNSVTNIGGYAFYGCNSLTNVLIEGRMKEIGNSAFADCTSLINFFASNGIENVGQGAFAGCRSLNKNFLDNCIEYIGQEAFRGCDGLADSEGFVIYRGVLYHYSGTRWDVIVPDTVVSIGPGAFYDNDRIYSIKIPSSVKSIGGSAFFDCGSLDMVEFADDSVISIGSYAFAWCKSLDGMIFPNSCASVGENLFRGCNNLKNVTISEGMKEIGNGMFWNCSSLKEVTIPDSILSIGALAFQYCGALERVTIGANVASIGVSAFDYCRSLKEVYICDIAKWCEINFGDSQANPLCYAKDFYLSGEKVIDLVIPDGIKNIGDYAFMSYNSLAKVVLPDSLTEIGAWAFCGCDYLADVCIGVNVTNIGERAFYSSGIRDIKIPDCVTYIGNDAFAWCYSLTNVFFEGNAPKIVESIFDGVDPMCIIYIERGSTGWNVNIPGEWDGIDIDYVYRPPEWTIVDGVLVDANLNGATEIIIPNSVTNIGDWVFSGCGSLASVIIPDHVTSIGTGAFENCWSLTEVMIPHGVTNIGDWLFSGCSSLCNITIPESVVNIGDRAFSSCSSLTRVTIPNSVTNIGDLAFSSCWSITSITLSENLKTIGDYAFSSCSWLESITLPASLKSVGSGIFSGCTSLTNIKINENNMYLQLENDFLLSKDGTELISYLGSKATIDIPDNVECIKAAAFSGCDLLKSVTMPNSVVCIGDSAFEYCRSLSNIIIPEGVASVGDYAFYFCGSLEGMTLPNSVTNIGERAFAWCESLKNVVIPDSVIRIGSWAFEGCDNSLYERTLVPGVLTIDGWVVGYEIPLPDELNLRGIRGVSDSAFCCSSELVSIVIPDSVLHIGSFAFAECSLLARVFFEGDAPRMGQSVFSGTKNDCTAYVESDSTGWNADIPGEWNGIKIKYSSLPVDFVLGGKWVEGVLGSGTVKGYEDNSSNNGMSVKFTADDSSSVWIETVVTNSGIVSFDWKISSESFKSMKIDHASFSIDQNEIFWINGEVGWTNLTFTVKGDGPHTLRWTYTKDLSGSAGDDCAWLSEVCFTPTVNVFFSSNGADTGSVPETIYGICGNTVFLPESGTLSKAMHTFGGWTDGVEILGGGTEYVLKETNVVMSAVWSPKVVTPPYIEVPRGYITEKAVVSIFCPMNGAEIRYTIDGSEPTEESELYTAPFEIAGTKTIRAIAFMDDWFASPEASATAVRAPWTIGECLNAPDLTFDLDGASFWCRDLTESHDGVASMQSGYIGDGDKSILRLKVGGAGQISFWWKVSSESYKQYQVDYISFSIDGVEKKWIGGKTDWEKIDIPVEGFGEHILTWTYIKDGSGADGDDCAWLDEITWTSVSAETQTTLVSVPFAWLQEKYPSITDAAAFEAKANEVAANGANKVWECYVAGIDPTDTTAKFVTKIEMVDGKPVITWEPDMNDGAGKTGVRTYKILGSTDLKTWMEVADEAEANFNFFKVEVSMP